MLEEGSLFGRYRILGMLGKGGMGQVYRAHDTLLRRDVAIKILLDGPAGEGATLSDSAARLLREARAAAALSHPNAISVFDVGEVDGTGYIAMEIVSGKPLRKYVGDPTVLPDRKLRWLVAVAEVLDAAHRAGLVHRDIKPENIVVNDDDSIKVLDFGIAKRVESIEMRPAPPVGADGPPSFRTQDGRIRGTPGYIAPEVLTTAAFDARSDQFAWGVVAYELFTDLRPSTIMPSEHTGDVLTMKIRALGIPAVVGETILRSLAARPDLRFPNMSVIAATLRTVIVPASLDPSTTALVLSPRSSDTMSTAPTATMSSSATSTALAPLASGLADRRPMNRKVGVGLGAVALTVVLAFAGRGLLHASTPAPGPTGGTPPAAAEGTPPISFHPSHLRRVTFGDGCDEFPSFTPDSKFIIYDGLVGSDSFIFEMSVDGESKRQITKMGHGWDMVASLSSDGTQIAYLRAAETTQTFVVDRAGTSEAHPVATGVVRPTWSVDGSGVWAGEPNKIELHDARTGAVTRSLALPVTVTPMYVVERPSGDFLLNVRPDHENTSVVGLALLPAKGSLRWLLSEEPEETFTITPDGRHALLPRERPGVETELADVPLDGSPVTSLAASGVRVFKGLAFSNDGRHVVWSNCHLQTELMKRSRSGAVEVFDRDPSWNDSAVAWSAATDRTVLLSDRSGKKEAWVHEPGGSAHVLSMPLDKLTGLALSDDGKWLALYGVSQPVQVVPLDGGAPPRALDGGNGVGATFIHGSHDVAYTVTDDAGHLRVARASAEGGPSELFLGPDARSPAASPTDGRLAYLAGSDPSRLVPMIYDPKTRGASAISAKLEPGNYHSISFSPDAKRVFVLYSRPELIEVILATGEVRRTELPESWRNLAFVRGEMVFARERWRGNLWMGDDPL